MTDARQTSSDVKEEVARLERNAERVAWYFLTLPFVFLAIGVQSASLGAHAPIGSALELLAWAALFFSGLLAAANLTTAPSALRLRGRHDSIREILQNPIIRDNPTAKGSYEEQGRAILQQLGTLEAMGDLRHAAHRIALLLGIPALLVARGLQAWAL